MPRSGGVAPSGRIDGSPAPPTSPPRGGGRSRRIRTSPHRRPTTAARPRGLTPLILAMATPSRGANPAPRRRAHVPQDLAGRRGTRKISRGRDRPTVGGLANDDTPVAIAGAFTRPRLQQAEGGAPVSTPGLAHRASLRGGSPTQGAQFASMSRREAHATHGRQPPTAGAPRLAHRASQRRLPRIHEAGPGSFNASRATTTVGARPAPPMGRAGISRPWIGGLANDSASVGVSRTRAGPLPVHHLGPSRVFLARSPLGPGM